MFTKFVVLMGAVKLRLTTHVLLLTPLPTTAFLPTDSVEKRNFGSLGAKMDMMDFVPLVVIGT